jgi:hypothetical protein
MPTITCLFFFFIGSCVLCQAHSLSCSHALCVRGCGVFMSHLQWQAIPFKHHIFSYDAYTKCNSYSKWCSKLRPESFPVQLFQRDLTIYSYMKMFWATASILDYKRTCRRRMMTDENGEIYAGLETVYRHICTTAQNSTEMLHVHPYETTVVHKL